MSAVRPDKPEAEILVVEDNPADAWLIRDCLLQVDGRLSVSVLEDGAEALGFLLTGLEDNEHSLPDLVLLDLNLPGRNGCEVLAEVKRVPGLASVPVVVLTSSTSPEDISQVYRLQGNSYVTKPTDPDQFAQVVSAIATYWLSTAQLPRPARSTP